MADKSEYEKMVSGELYNCADTELTAMRSSAKLLMREYNSEIGYKDDRSLRMKHLRKLFGSIGDDATIEPGIYVDYGTNITIGKSLYCNFNVVMLDWYVNYLNAVHRTSFTNSLHVVNKI